jgi:gluconate 2-dehydrogenase gamma chain
VPSTRRSFLARLGGAGVVLLAAPAPARSQDAALGRLDEAYAFFTRPEAALVEAAVARLIPSDDLGPGGVEAGVPYFIDQQLAGAYGAGARTYLQGPFGDATPEQGYQLPLTPQQLYRTALADLDAHCASAHGATFAALSPADQDAVLRGLESGEVSLARVPGRVFFDALLADVKQGFFSDPMYGGNRDKVGWVLIGFPGVGANYAQLVEQHGRPYRVAPVSIADVQQGRVARDAHGHPVHPGTGDGRSE